MEGLHCLDLANGLQEVWCNAEDAFDAPAVLLASTERILALTHHGELVLFATRTPGFSAISRLRVFPESAELYAHPALVDDRLYLRDTSTLVCLDLAPGGPGPVVAQTTSR
jgi:hypothetical protein